MPLIIIALLLQRSLFWWNRPTSDDPDPNPRLAPSRLAGLPALKSSHAQVYNSQSTNQALVKHYSQSSAPFLTLNNHSLDAPRWSYNSQETVNRQ